MGEKTDRIEKERWMDGCMDDKPMEMIKQWISRRIAGWINRQIDERKNDWTDNKLIV